MDTENANNPTGATDVSVSDERATMTLMDNGEIRVDYHSPVYQPAGPFYWEDYDDMIADRDLATKLGRKIRRLHGIAREALRRRG